MLPDIVKPMTLYWKPKRILKNCERDFHTCLKKTKPRTNQPQLLKGNRNSSPFFPRANIYRLTANVCVSRDYYTYVKKNTSRENDTTEIEWALTNCGDRFIKLKPEKEKWVRAHFKTSVRLVILFRGCLVLNRQYTKTENVNAAGSITWDFPSQGGLYADWGVCSVLIHPQTTPPYQGIFACSSKLNQNYLKPSPSHQDSLCSEFF